MSGQETFLLFFFALVTGRLHNNPMLLGGMTETGTVRTVCQAGTIRPPWAFHVPGLFRFLGAAVAFTITRAAFSIATVGKMKRRRCFNLGYHGNGTK